MSAWRGVNGSEGTDHLGLALSNVKVNDVANLSSNTLM